METPMWTDQVISESAGKDLIDEGRASYLLGLPKEQLREISQMSGLGQMAAGKTALRLVFTYEDLCELCRLIDGPVC